MPMVMESVLCIGNGQTNQSVDTVVGALNCMHDEQALMIQRRQEVTEESEYIVRRLTPLECERLQGYPDNWTDIGEWVDSKGKTRKPADAPRYKALGNSIALPQWQWIIDRMAAYLPEDATLGSLFDGIGGFPLCWERTHGKGTARWASEIEEFPMAVTKRHFPEEGAYHEAHGRGFQGRYPDDESLLPRPVEESAKSRWAAFLTPTSRRNGSNKADKIVRQGNTR